MADTPAPTAVENVPLAVAFEPNAEEFPAVAAAVVPQAMVLPAVAVAPSPVPVTVLSQTNCAAAGCAARHDATTTKSRAAVRSDGRTHRAAQLRRRESGTAGPL